MRTQHGRGENEYKFIHGLYWYIEDVSYFMQQQKVCYEVQG